MSQFPPNLVSKKWLSRLFPVFGKLGEGPPGPLWISYWPFVGPSQWAPAILAPDHLGPGTMWDPSHFGTFYAEHRLLAPHRASRANRNPDGA